MHLEWSARLKRLTAAVLACMPDVLCLQEVDDFAGFEAALRPHRPHLAPVAAF